MPNVNDEPLSTEAQQYIDDVMGPGIIAPENIIGRTVTVERRMAVTTGQELVRTPDASVVGAWASTDPWEPSETVVDCLREICFALQAQGAPDVLQLQYSKDNTVL